MEPWCRYTTMLLVVLSSSAFSVASSCAATAAAAVGFTDSHPLTETPGSANATSALPLLQEGGGLFVDGFEHDAGGHSLAQGLRLAIDGLAVSLDDRDARI